MAYSRQVAPRALATGRQLTAALIGIGFGLAGRGRRDANLEDTLVAAAIEGMERDDLRVLSLLVTWLGVHHPWINADRLVRLASGQEAPRVRAFWAAVGAWLHADRRFARLERLHRGAPVHLLGTGSAFQLRRRGEDPRFFGSQLRVPLGVLRDRAEDVLSPREMAGRHRAYRQRVTMGPSYRADMWALLESDPALAPAELARRTYGSYATAWRAKHDFDLLAA